MSIYISIVSLAGHASEEGDDREEHGNGRLRQGRVDTVAGPASSSRRRRDAAGAGGSTSPTFFRPWEWPRRRRGGQPRPQRSGGGRSRAWRSSGASAAAATARRHVCGSLPSSTRSGRAFHALSQSTLGVRAARRPQPQRRAGHVEVPVGLPARARFAAVCGLARARQRPLGLLAGAFRRTTRTVSVRLEPCTESSYRYRCSRRCGTTRTRSGPRGRRATGQSPTCISGVVFIVSRATRRLGNP